jgi:4-hydroxy-tetrahydrodipicolinate synthase
MVSKSLVGDKVVELRGSLPALLTPFKNGKVDEKAYAKFIAWQIAEGSHGLVPVGTTGESPTVSHEEHRRCIEIAVETAAGKVPVVAGAGSNSTEEALGLAKFAKKAGADAAMLVCPYYNKPTQEGLYQHFAAVAKAVDLPIVVYNVPGRTVSNISAETLARLVKDCPNVVAVKDATGDISRPSRMRMLTNGGFTQLCGEDALALGFNAHGGNGCISVTANVAPRLCSEFQEATLKGDFKAALRLQDRLMPLHIALFVETNPSPVKYAASLLGHCEQDVRLPMVECMDSTKKQVRDAMVHAGLLN